MISELTEPGRVAPAINRRNTTLGTAPGKGRGFAARARRNGTRRARRFLQQFDRANSQDSICSSHRSTSLN